MHKVQKVQTNSNTRCQTVLGKIELKDDAFNLRIALIQELIPIGLMAINEMFQHEITASAGV